MLNFFAIVLIIFIGILLLVLKKRSFRRFINKGKLHSVKLKKNKNNNNKFLSNKKSFLYNHEAKKYSLFYKNSQRNKMFNLFQGNTEDKLKALKIAEELSDKSTSISCFTASTVIKSPCFIRAIFPPTAASGAM